MLHGLTVRFAVLASVALIAACAAPSSRSPLDPSRSAREFQQRRLDAEALGLPTPQEGWALADLQHAARSLNPEISTARAELEVARAATQTSAQRANPELSLSLERAFTGGAQAWLYAATLELLLLRPGERERATQLAALDQWIVQANFEQTVADVHTAVRAAFLDVEQSAVEVQTLARLVDVRAALLESIRVRTQAGELASWEQVRARVELAEASSRLGEARALGADARVRLAAGVGVPVDALDAVRLHAAAPPEIAAENGGPDGAVHTDADGLMRALVRNFEVQRSLHEYAKADLALQAETAGRWPALHLAPGYAWDQGDRKLTLGSSLELPVFNRNEGLIAEALARRTAAASRLVAAQVRVYEQVERARFGLNAAQGAARDAASSLALAREMQEAETRRLASGASDRPTLLAAELALLEAELRHIRARHVAQRASAVLDDALRLPAEDPASPGTAFALTESAR
ncbi:MAG: TolC family protein [Panacagrimonas sp.]